MKTHLEIKATVRQAVMIQLISLVLLEHYKLDLNDYSELWKVENLAEEDVEKFWVELSSAEKEQFGSDYNNLIADVLQDFNQKREIIQLEIFKIAQEKQLTPRYTGNLVLASFASYFGVSVSVWDAMFEDHNKQVAEENKQHNEKIALLGAV